MVDKKNIEKVAIITKRNNDNYSDLIKKLYKYLKGKKKEILLDTNSCTHFKGAKGHHKAFLLRTADLAIVMGGDGTILKTARKLTRKRTLILGVNLGNLGFLTECGPDKLFECLERVFKGQFNVDKRTLLRVTLYRSGDKIDTFLALNDAVINQGAFARLIKLDLEVDNRKIVKFNADGLIIATPTGSTAHSLSAGGPIVHPRVESLTITPICPSSLSMRPIVLPDNRQLTVRIETERKEETSIIGLTMDGQDMIVLQYGDIIKFRTSKRKIHMIRTGNRYYKMLRSKLSWGGI